MDILQGLNDKQKEAVQCTEGPLLIVAGAGAGKTKTLTHRIMNLVKSGVQPDSILAITFTNKAAQEMRDRVSTLTASLSGDARNTSVNTPFVSTFHALGVHMLRESGAHISIPRHFTILDRTDSVSLIKEALKNRHYDPKQHEPRRVLNAISHEKNNLITLDDYSVSAENKIFPSIVADVWAEYDRLLTKRNALDFDDLIIKPVRLLDTNEKLRTYYQRRFRYIHVDEYQDTNTAQYTLTNLLVGKEENICVVGDGDQNIYGWRGANMKNLLHFERDYPNATTILLEQNYRSTQTILAVANDIIQKNKIRIEKNLFTDNTEGEPITVYEAFSEVDEARFVALQSKELIGAGIQPRDIAVLYRANFQSRALEEAFLREQVPYQVLGTKFFERKEVKDVLAYIRAALNPEAVIDYARIINVPTRGIGKVTLARILAGEKDTLTPKMAERVDAFEDLLERIRVYMTKHTPAEVIKYILAETGLEKELADGTDDDLERLENIKELATLATKYNHLPPIEATEHLLADAALASDQDSLEKKEDAVKLMTVHAAKGLEFPYVFIVGLEQDLFPHIKMGNARQSPEDAEEERRLFYVALTRAERKVFLTHATVRTIFGSQQINVPSEFLTDIDPAHLDQDTAMGSVDQSEPDHIEYLQLD